jgi:similar to spore coat protein
MSNIIQTIAGMGHMTEEIIAADALFVAKAAIKANALVLAECCTPEVRNTVKKHLEVAIQSHERIVNFMIDKGYYFPYDPERQIAKDMGAVDTLLKIG